MKSIVFLFVVLSFSKTALSYEDGLQWVRSLKTVGSCQTQSTFYRTPGTPFGVLVIAEEKVPLIADVQRWEPGGMTDRTYRHFQSVDMTHLPTYEVESFCRRVLGESQICYGRQKISFSGVVQQCDMIWLE